MNVRMALAGMVLLLVAACSQPPSNLGAALIVTPTLQTLPAGSSAEFGLAIAPSCQAHPDAFSIDQLPASWTAEFLGSPIPCKETLVLNTPGTARPGSYSIRVTAASEAGSRMASPPRFYLYRSLVWPEPNSIVAHGAPGTLNVGLPRTENEGWQLEAEVTPGLYLLVFERDSYGSSTDRGTIPASLTYRLEALP